MILPASMLLLDIEQDVAYRWCVWRRGWARSVI